MGTPSPTPLRRLGGLRWLRVVVGALVVASLLRVLVVEPFRIPSPSMEPGLQEGDFLAVSKLAYGPRLPVTLALPFTPWYLPAPALPVWRLPGAGTVQRGEVVVFNQPREDGPLDRRTPYIKRVVGLPGDTVRLRSKRLYVDGRPYIAPAPTYTDWQVTLREGPQVPPTLLLDRLGLDPGRAEVRARKTLQLAATDAEAAALRSRPDVAAVDPIPAAAGRSGPLFPFQRGFTLDDYGPLVVPGRAAPQPLTEATWPVLRDVLEQHEGRTVERLGVGRFSVDGVEVDTVTFRQDYYFVLGDNRDRSADSRVWGFVPFDHLIGKAVWVYYAWNPETRRIRTDRLGRIR